MTTSPADSGRPPVVWKLASWQPAVLILVTAALAAWAVYGGARGIVLGVVIVLAVAFLVAGVASARMYLVADDSGIGVRKYVGESSLTWDELTGVAIGRKRGGSLTLELQTDGRGSIEVPPALVLPLRPTSIERTRGLLRIRANELEARRPA